MSFEMSPFCLRRRKVSASSQLYDDLYAYAKKNLLWLNVYVKDSFSTHIVRDERQTRIRSEKKCTMTH